MNVYISFRINLKSHNWVENLETVLKRRAFQIKQSLCVNMNKPEIIEINYLNYAKE